MGQVGFGCGRLSSSTVGVGLLVSVGGAEDNEHMFDSSRVAMAKAALEGALEMPVALADGVQARAALRTAQEMADLLEGWRAQLLDQLDETAAYSDDGAPSAVAWARRELRLDDRTTARLRAAGRTMRMLPGVGAAMAAGEIRLDHLAAFTGALRRIDHEVLVDATEGVLLPLAKQAPPADLRKAIDRVDQLVRPERAVKAWEDGMDKRDIKLARAGEGFHLTGFLDVELGARLRSFLIAASSPRSQGECEATDDADRGGRKDRRTAAQRRADALSELLDVAAAGGVPSDRRLRPQVHVTVDADWLAQQPGAAPPELEGFGSIGRDLYGYLACTGDHTEVLTDGVTGGPTPFAAVLNVGRTRRLATAKQREAVRARQRGHCANPGCRHRIADIHHVSWWRRDGGPTDFENLVGLCRSCHMNAHAGRLGITVDGAGGFVFMRRFGASKREIDDRERLNRRRLSDYLRELGTVRDGVRPKGPTVAGPQAVTADIRSAATTATTATTAPEHEAEVGDVTALHHLRRHTLTPRT
ncbi:HNH endonuclease [Mumia sp. Pv 4-285]|uniref:HNH endonuclease n=1 Tax=Mumia qirimensis TaxID=3234852 RepID=UPI00351D07C8